MNVFTVLASLPDKDDFVSKIIPNWVSFVVQLSALVIMLIVFFLVGYKPVKKMIQKRQDYIENNIKESETMSAEAKNNLEQSKERVIASKKEAMEIISEAQNKAIERRDVILEQTKLEVKEMKKKAEIDIENSRKDALNDIKNQIVDVALDASKKVLEREFNQADQDKMVDEFIKGKVN